jgi:general secretion pathway protein M
MKQLWPAFKKTAWGDRSRRERQIISIASIILLPAMVYFVLWQPAHNEVAKLRSMLPVMRMQEARMKRQAEEVELLRHRSKPAVLDSFALKTVVETSATRYQLRDAMDQLDILEPNGVHIAFSSVPFAQWLRWIRDLQQEQHVRIDSLDVTALPSAGMVKINANLVNGTNR